MKALEEKWNVVWSVGRKIGVKDMAMYQWKARGHIPGAWHIKLINASGGKLAMKDFVID